MNKYRTPFSLMLSVLLVACGGSDDSSDPSGNSEPVYEPTSLDFERELVVDHSETPDGIYFVRLHVDGLPLNRSEPMHGQYETFTWKGVLQIVAEEGSDKWGIIQCPSEYDKFDGEYSLNDDGNMVFADLNDAVVAIENNREFSVSGINPEGRGDDARFVFEGVKIAESSAPDANTSDSRLISYTFPGSRFQINTYSDGETGLTEPVTMGIRCFEDYRESGVEYEEGVLTEEYNARLIIASAEDSEQKVAHAFHQTYSARSDWNAETEAFERESSQATALVIFRRYLFRVQDSIETESYGELAIDGVSLNVNSTPLTAEFDMQVTKSNSTKTVSAELFLPLGE
ncbi:Uncharacterised protein [BD1-7 clade bacterium]|uniref:Uncharacterized protein n=1 Tax=BD1-7 clade bacterium TaxID=2029982 RepID=A0A5S9PKU2_9GAMM|nr:Uncharacterised protein [BD1-7 clade bacterium]CAA0104404.1 Uncharacterised protein [BD1-7 clade bacterium]